MVTIHHIICGTLHVLTYRTVVCYCLLLQDGDRLALVDSGIGLLAGESDEVLRPSIELIWVAESPIQRKDKHEHD